MAWKMKPRNGALSKLRIEVVKLVNKRITATFKKLFAIRMVANKCCGLWSNCTMFLSAFNSLSSSSFVDCGSSEKNATSDAEMSAESESNSKLTVKEIIADIKAVVVKEWTEIPAKVE